MGILGHIDVYYVHGDLMCIIFVILQIALENVMLPVTPQSVILLK